jgi:putative ABC transport system permease protein
MFNVEVSGLQIEPVAVVVQIVVGVAVPLVAALIPVIGGVRITVREAVNSQGIGGDFGESWLDRLVERMTSIRIGSRGLPRPMALSLRNAFRRKARVALTLATLTFSGAMFTIVLSTGGSFNHTIANNFSLGEDVALKLENPQRVARVVEIAESVPGVDKAEVWSKENATLLLNSGEEQSVGVVGVPPDSAIFSPNIVGGRGLRPDDDHALIFTVRLAEEEGIQVGDEITLKMEDEESHWRVVGLYLSVDDVNQTFFVPFDVLGREAGSFGKGDGVKVLATNSDIESQQRLIEALKEVFTAQHVEVVDSWSASQQLQESQASFGILTSLLLVMVILTAVVGGIGLMGTMSMNVVERRREIGVMRAIGASSLIIVGMFVAEGVLVGLLSWLLAAPLSYPGARLFSNLIGDVILAMPLDFVYASGGMLLWLMIVTLLSALASLWPALQATKISVRESLAYE